MFLGYDSQHQLYPLHKLQGKVYYNLLKAIAEMIHFIKVILPCIINKLDDTLSKSPFLLL